MTLAAEGTGSPCRCRPDIISGYEHLSTAEGNHAAGAPWITPSLTYTRSRSLSPFPPLPLLSSFVFFLHSLLPLLHHSLTRSRPSAGIFPSFSWSSATSGRLPMFSSFRVFVSCSRAFSLLACLYLSLSLSLPPRLFIFPPWAPFSLLNPRLLSLSWGTSRGYDPVTPPHSNDSLRNRSN